MADRADSFRSAGTLQTGGMDRCARSALPSAREDGWRHTRSTDGTTIAFQSNRSGNLDIWVVSVDGGEPVNVAQSPAADENPVWSPDGTRIAFASSRDGNREIYVMDADGSDQRRVTANDRADRHPDWSPDGSR
ncbi:MAG: hypothetical protein KY460_08000, partial [Actinobacteria bacterium]|nr:hypothetical protein [Actinomycetota bacterium]